MKNEFKFEIEDEPKLKFKPIAIFFGCIIVALVMDGIFQSIEKTLWP